MSAQAERTTHSARILLAEDNPELRKLLARILRAAGYDVVEAIDGADLLDQLGSAFLEGRSVVPELVLSDVRMPGVSGIRVLAGMREADWSTPFVLLTAFGSEEFREEALRMGASAVLDKPIDANHLCDVIRSFLPL